MTTDSKFISSVGKAFEGYDAATAHAWSAFAGELCLSPAAAPSVQATEEDKIFRQFSGIKMSI